MEYHIEELITKLNKDCFAIISVRPYLLYEVERMMYFFLSICIILCPMG